MNWWEGVTHNHTHTHTHTILISFSPHPSFPNRSYCSALAFMLLIRPWPRHHQTTSDNSYSSTIRGSLADHMIHSHYYDCIVPAYMLTSVLRALHRRCVFVCSTFLSLSRVRPLSICPLFEGRQQNVHIYEEKLMNNRSKIKTVESQLG